jgi:uncharacterized protein (DUF1800 family)
MTQSIGAFARTAGRLALGAVVSLGAVATAAAQSHFPNTMFNDGLENANSGPASDPDAARFLAQATFGPTDAEIAHLRALGYEGWLTEQFAAAPTSHLGYVNWVANTLDEGIGSITFREAWFIGALGGPDPQNNLVVHKDQLRQRIAFALSEIFVVSGESSMLTGFPTALAYYYDLLGANAFGNFRTLLEQVTLSPAMGVYLNMMGNPRADLAHNVHPDENYAREVNQLFSIGLDMLNVDGTLKLSGGKPIPTYGQAQVTAFAHVFTGWSWSNCSAQSFQWCGPDYETGANLVQQMAPFAAYHDNGTQAINDIPNKQLLSYPGAVNGGVLANGGTPQSDLAFALDNIFNHPNVGPYIGKQLIQRLVTSNPSPAYVQRVANAFNDDGSPQHVRGNLQAVVRQVLLDPEARYGHYANPTTFGKLREPLLRLTHFWRAMGAVHKCGLNYLSNGVTYHYGNQPYRYAGYSTAWSTDDVLWGAGIGQAALDAPSVFNFFKPTYVPPGEMTALGLLGPEFQLATDSVLTNSTNSTIWKAWSLDTSVTCDPNDEIGDVRINRAQDYALAGSANGGPADPADRLVDAYSVRFMSGQMSPFMRQTLLSYLNQIDSGDGANWKAMRISRALLLIMTSPEYMVQK